MGKAILYRASPFFLLLINFIAGPLGLQKLGSAALRSRPLELLPGLPAIPEFFVCNINLNLRMVRSGCLGSTGSLFILSNEGWLC